MLDILQFSAIKICKNLPGMFNILASSVLGQMVLKAKNILAVF